MICSLFGSLALTPYLCGRNRLNANTAQIAFACSDKKDSANAFSTVKRTIKPHDGNPRSMEMLEPPHRSNTIGAFAFRRGKIDQKGIQ